MLRLLTADRGDYLKTTDGLTGGSATFSLVAVNADLIMAVWDSEGTGTSKPSAGPASQDAPLLLCPTVAVDATAAVAYDFNWMLLGRDDKPLAFTATAWRNGAAVVVPPTRLARSHASNGVAQPEAIHAFRYYIWAISANAAGVAPAVNVYCRARLLTLG